VFHFNKDLTAS